LFPRYINDGLKAATARSVAAKDAAKDSEQEMYGLAMGASDPILSVEMSDIGLHITH
jgi:hypothetical protein